MYISRKLLYHRGVDDRVGTYVTDYIEAALCFAFGTHLLLKICFPKARENRRENVVTQDNLKSPKNTIAVITLQYSVATLALIGGLVHQFLQEAEPYETWTDNWTWLILWRVGSSLSAVMIFGFMFIGQQIMAEEKVLILSRRYFIIFWSFVSLTCLGVFAYCLALIADKKDPWTLKVPFIFAYLASIGNIIMVAIATHLRNRTRETTTKPDNVDDKNVGEPSTENNSKESNESNCRIDLILHTLAPCVFVLAGAIHYYLAHVQSCDEAKFYQTDSDLTNSDQPDLDHSDSSCPLPDYFNHNALLHVMVILSLFVYFLAETFAIKRRRQEERNV